MGEHHQSRERRQFSIAMVLALSFGTLVCVAVLSVLGISLYTGLANTRDLLQDKATSQMEAVERNLTDILYPIENQVRYLADLIYSGEVDIIDHEALDKALIASLGGINEKAAIAFVYPDMTTHLAARDAPGAVHYDNQNEPNGQDTMEDILLEGVAHWGPLLYAPDIKQTVMSFRQPIIRNGTFIGVLIGAIPVAEVRAAVKANDNAQTDGRFVLYGKDHVLTYEGFQVHSDIMTYEGVTPKLSEIPDKVLAAIWGEQHSPFNLDKSNRDINGHFVEVEDEDFLFVYRSLEGYADKPLIIGYRIRDEDAMRELRRLAYAGFVGMAILAISIIIAFFLGRKIARPIHALADASQSISTLEFNTAKELPGSRLKELNEASEAYNTMLRGLKWFENYVPKSLVKKLMTSGEAHSENRNVTVMFTDIVGFTPMAEHMGSEAVADILNHHFEMVTACIESEGGTVDKFIGDAVMAFWGAPEHQDDHAARACRAARAIREVIEADNKERVKNGQPPIRMRIGLHTGQLVVGNIGSSGRLNYTVVGDTVNIAQRIEQLGKISESEEQIQVVTLVSSALRDEAGDGFKCEAVGAHNVKGRTGEVEIYRLL